MVRAPVGSGCLFVSWCRICRKEHLSQRDGFDSLSCAWPEGCWEKWVCDDLAGCRTRCPGPDEQFFRQAPYWEHLYAVPLCTSGFGWWSCYSTVLTDGEYSCGCDGPKTWIYEAEKVTVRSGRLAGYSDSSQWQKWNIDILSFNFLILVNYIDFTASHWPQLSCLPVFI